MAEYTKTPLYFDEDLYIEEPPVRTNQGLEDYWREFAAGTSEQILGSMGEASALLGRGLGYKSLEEMGKGVTDYAYDAAGTVREKQSQDYKEAMQGSFFDAPVTQTGGMLAGSAPSTLASIPLGMGAGLALRGVGSAVTGGLTRVGAAKTAETLSKAAGTSLGKYVAGAAAIAPISGVQAGLINAAEAEQNIRNADIETLKDTPGYQRISQLPEIQDIEDADIREKAIVNRMQAETGVETFQNTALTTGAISALAGGGAVGQLIGGTGRQGVIRGTLRGAGLEAGEESLQSASEQFIQNQAAQEYYDRERGTFEGVGEAAAMGALLGGLMGAPLGAASAIAERPDAPVTPEPTQEPTDTVESTASVDVTEDQNIADAIEESSNQAEERQEGILSLDDEKISKVFSEYETDLFDNENALVTPVVDDYLRVQQERPELKSKRKTILDTLFKLPDNKTFSPEQFEAFQNDPVAYVDGRRKELKGKYKKAQKIAQRYANENRVIDGFLPRPGETESAVQAEERAAAEEARRIEKEQQKPFIVSQAASQAAQSDDPNAPDVFREELVKQYGDDAEVLTQFDNELQRNTAAQELLRAEEQKAEREKRKVDFPTNWKKLEDFGASREVFVSQAKKRVKAAEDIDSLVEEVKQGWSNDPVVYDTAILETANRLIAERDEARKTDTKKAEEIQQKYEGIKPLVREAQLRTQSLTDRVGQKTLIEQPTQVSAEVEKENTSTPVSRYDDNISSVEKGKGRAKKVRELTNVLAQEVALQSPEEIQAAREAVQKQGQKAVENFDLLVSDIQEDQKILSELDQEFIASIDPQINLEANQVTNSESVKPLTLLRMQGDDKLKKEKEKVINDLDGLNTDQIEVIANALTNTQQVKATGSSLQEMVKQIKETGTLDVNKIPEIEGDNKAGLEIKRLQASMPSKSSKEMKRIKEKIDGLRQSAKEQQTADNKLADTLFEIVDIHRGIIESKQPKTAGTETNPVAEVVQGLTDEAKTKAQVEQVDQTLDTSEAEAKAVEKTSDSQSEAKAVEKTSDSQSEAKAVEKTSDSQSEAIDSQGTRGTNKGIYARESLLMRQEDGNGFLKELGFTGTPDENFQGILKAKDVIDPGMLIADDRAPMVYDTSLQMNAAMDALAKEKAVIDKVQQLIGKNRADVRVGDIKQGGLTTIGRNLIHIVVSSRYGNMLSNAIHEAMHVAIETGMLTKFENQILKRAFKPNGRMFNKLENALKKINPELAMIIRNTPEEVHSYGVQLYAEGILQADGRTKKIMDKVWDNVERFDNFLRGYGFKNWEDIYVSFLKGDMAQRVSNEGLVDHKVLESQYSTRTTRAIYNDLSDTMYSRLTRTIKNISSMQDQSTPDTKIGMVLGRLEQAQGIFDSLFRTQLGLAQRIPSYASIMQTLKDMDAYNSTLMTRFSKIMKPWEKASPEDNAVVSVFLQYAQARGLARDTLVENEIEEEVKAYKQQNPQAKRDELNELRETLFEQKTKEYAGFTEEELQTGNFRNFDGIPNELSYRGKNFKGATQINELLGKGKVRERRIQMILSGHEASIEALKIQKESEIAEYKDDITSNVEIALEQEKLKLTELIGNRDEQPEGSPEYKKINRLVKKKTKQIKSIEENIKYISRKIDSIEREYDRKINSGFISFQRNGKFQASIRVVAKDANGNILKTATIFHEQADTVREVERIAQEYQQEMSEKMPDSDNTIEEHMVNSMKEDGSEVNGVAIADWEVQTRIGEVSQGMNVHNVPLRQFISQLEQLGVRVDSPEYVQLVRNMLDRQANYGKMFRRRNVAGAKVNAYDALTKMASNTAHTAAASRYMKQITGDIKRLEERALNPDDLKAVNVLKDTVKYVLDPQEEAQTIRSLATVGLLGFNISSAAIQAFTLPNLVAPRLVHAMGGNGKSFFENMASAYSEISLATKDVSTVTDPSVFVDYMEAMQDPNADLTKFKTNLGKPIAEVFNEEEIRGLAKAYEEGMTDAQQVYNMQGGTGGSLVGRSITYQKVTRYAMDVFRKVEITVRQATLLASMRVANKAFANGDEAIGRSLNRDENGEYIFDVPGPNSSLDKFAEIYNFANNVIDDTSGRYSKLNRAKIMRGGIGSVVTQFYMPSFIMLDLLRGMDNKSKGLMLGALFLSAGMGGLPFAEDMLNIFEWLGKQLGFTQTPKHFMRQYIKQFSEGMTGMDLSHHVMNGFFSGIPVLGFDVRQRAGMGQIIPGTAGFTSKGFSGIVDDLPALSVAQSGLDFASAGLGVALTGGDRDALHRMGMSVPLSGVRNMYRGGQALIEGEMYDDRGRVVRDFTPMEAFKQMFGFMPPSLAKEYAVQNIIRTERQTMLVRKRKFVDGIVNAIRNGDVSRQQKLLEVWRDYNRSAPPEYRMELTKRTIRDALKAASQTQMERSIENAPKFSRAVYQGLI